MNLDQLQKVPKGHDIFDVLVLAGAYNQGLWLAIYIVLLIYSGALATLKKRNLLTLVGLLVIFGLSSLQIARLLIPQDYWLTSREVVSPQLVMLVNTPSRTEAVSYDWSRVWPTVARWQDEFERAASYCGVDPYLAAAVSARESSGNPDTCSTQGACGLMGLMPGTAASLGVTDRFNPAQNILGGTCYLRQMLERYRRLDLALAAYNAGPGNVDKYGGIPPFSETKVYVRDVLKFYSEFSPLPPSGGANKFSSAPVAGSYRITQGYGSGHPALDIAGSTTLLAVMDGVVRYVGPLYSSASGDARCLQAGCLGRFAIVLDHGGGTFTVYGHNSCSYVQANQPVKAGEPIGCVGSEGKSTGPHLHFELRVGEVWNGNLSWPWQGKYRDAVNPMPYLP